MVHKKMGHDKQALKYEKMASSTSKPLGGETKAKDNSLITTNQQGVPVKEAYNNAYLDTNKANQKYQELRKGIESSRFSQKQLAQLNYDKIHDELAQISDLYVKIGDFPRALQSAKNSLFFAKIAS
jgi:predicted ATP-binding protein involved in virulence